jgi:hypothetical protein
MHIYNLTRCPLSVLQPAVMRLAQHQLVRGPRIPTQLPHGSST